jgi:hypothetical protein
MIKETTSFIDVLKKFNEIEKWLNSLGISTKNKRFEKMKHAAELLAIEQENLAEGKKYDFKKLGREKTNLAYEIFPFLEIYESFNTSTDNDFISALKHVVDGPEYSSQENASTNVHRNHLFELRLAAKLASKGIKVKQFEDIVFDLDGYEIAIQCKRPMFENTLFKNVEEAQRQLQNNNNLDKVTRVRGIIALSVDKMIGLDISIEDYESIETLREEIITKAKSIEREHNNKWKKLYSKNVLAILLYFPFPIYVKSENNMSTSVNFYVIIPLIDYSTRFSEKRIMDKLEGLLK